MSEVRVIWLYQQYLSKIMKILDNSPTELAKDSQTTKALEISALLYVIVDCALFSSGKNADIRKAYGKLIQQTMCETFSKTRYMKRRFLARVDFYGAVLRGNQHVMGFFVPGMDLSGRESFITRCAVAFSDCCMGNEYINDYDNSPLLLLDIVDALAVFEQFVEPLSQVLEHLFMEVYQS